MTAILTPHEVAELRREIVVELIRAYGKDAVVHPTALVQALDKITKAILSTETPNAAS